MFRLTREVRFAINPSSGPNAESASAAASAPSNSHAGFPSLNGLGHYLALRATIAGELEPQSQYLLNIKQIDSAVRQVIPLADEAVRDSSAGPARLLVRLFERLRTHWPGASGLAPAASAAGPAASALARATASAAACIHLESLSLALSPFLSVSLVASELPMTRLSQKFEFSASHRLHNPQLSDEENRRIFGKCNNPLGHGHNYELQVTLVGEADEATGLLMDVPAFERIVAGTVIDRFDHRNLNAEVPEFARLIPSVENIARVIYVLLAPALRTERTKLASVTVWETPKTWCEYSEG